MSSASNLDTNTLGVPPRFGDTPCPPPCGKHTVNGHASLTASEHAANAAELLTWLDMLGLPPCERELRTTKEWGKK